jgi:hypothetical protein
LKLDSPEKLEGPNSKVGNGHEFFGWLSDGELQANGALMTVNGKLERRERLKVGHAWCSTMIITLA